MNKLRAVAWGGGGFSVLLAVWATIHYGGPLTRFLPAAAIGTVAATLPFGFAYAKSAVKSLHRRLADVDEGISAEKGSVFVSTTTINDPVECLESIVSAVRADDNYDEVTRGSFQEGPGLTVLYGGFHNSFVRITDPGRVVVTGASERTHDLAETVSEACSLSFDRTRDNPFDGLEPVKGASRVFFGILVFTIVVAGISTVGGAAYPSDAYNPAERTVIVGIDARGDLDPGTSQTDTRLSKAAFLVDIVDEESQEVRWEQNDSEYVTEHGLQALRVSEDARALLAAVRGGSPTPEQTTRADRIERQLAEAQRSVATALVERVDSGSVNETADMRYVIDRLRTTANESA